MEQQTHRPPHLFEDNAIYFLTGRTYFGFPHLKNDMVKKYFLEKVIQTKEKYNFQLFGWVILDNHYHILVRFGVAQFIARFIKELHGATAHYVGKINFATPIAPNYLREFYAGLTPFEQRQWERMQRELKFATPDLSTGVAPTGIAQFIVRIKPRPVWYQYFDTIIRSEHDFYAHLNYIHQNSVKHGYTEEMREFKFSSYEFYRKTKGKEWLADCFRKYPIVDFEPKGDAE